MPKITKEQISKLEGLKDNDRADLSAMLDEIETRDAQITQLTKDKQDSDQVVAKNKELADLNAKQKTELDALNLKLAEILKPKGDGKAAPMSFSVSDIPFFRAFIDAISGDETETPNP